MRKLFDYLQYAAVVCVMNLAGRIPRSGIRLIASLVAFSGWKLPPFGGLVRKNLRAAFPEKPLPEINRMVYENLKSLTMTVLEFFWLHRHHDAVDRIVTFAKECDESVEVAKRDPSRPVIFITPHMSNWELAGMILALHYGFRMATMVRTPRNPYLDRLISSGRMVRGVKIIHSKGGMLKLVHALDDGYSAGMLIDQNTRVRDGGIFIDFFGLPCSVTKSAAAVARRKNARVMVGAVKRNPDGSFLSNLKQLPKDTSEYASDEELTADVMKLSMELISLAPEQYLWMYKRFQNIPPDASPELKAKYPDYARVPGPKFFDIRNKKPTSRP